MITGIRREEKEEQKLNFLFRKKKIKSNWCLNSFALTSSQETNLPIMQPVWLDAHWPFLVLDKIIRYWDHLSSLTTRFIKFSLQNSFRPFAFHLNLFRLLDHHIVFKEQVLYNWKNPTWSLSLAWNEFIWRISKAQPATRTTVWPPALTSNQVGMATSTGCKCWAFSHHTRQELLRLVYQESEWWRILSEHEGTYLHSLLNF